MYGIKEFTVMSHLSAHFGLQGFGRINKKCRLARHLIIHCIQDGSHTKNVGCKTMRLLKTG